MFQKLITFAAWACLLFIAYATLVSIDSRPQLISSGYLTVFSTVAERFGAYLVLGILFCLAYPRHITFVCILVFGSAVILEFLQVFIPDRDARMVDAAEKLFGGAAGILLGDIVRFTFWADPKA